MNPGRHTGAALGAAHMLPAPCPGPQVLHILTHADTRPHPPRQPGALLLVLHPLSSLCSTPGCRPPWEGKDCVSPAFLTSSRELTQTSPEGLPAQALLPPAHQAHGCSKCSGTSLSVSTATLLCNRTTRYNVLFMLTSKHERNQSKVTRGNASAVHREWGALPPATSTWQETKAG